MTSTATSHHLSSETTPAAPSAAQIPLKSFNLPTFPPEAFTGGLSSLTLTADIKLEEYTDLLARPYLEIASLPSSIKSLTLELFSLGFPPAFLAELGKAVSLKSLTLYSQLFFGTTPASRDDALAFVRAQPALQELHLLDVFASPGQFTEFSEALSPQLKFLEINYTYRHSDPHFRSSIPSKELATFVKEGLVALTLSISAPDVTDDEEDREGTEEGMVPIVAAEAGGVVEKLLKAGKGLAMLDVTMFELSFGDAGKILDVCEDVKVLAFTIGLEKGWKDVFDLVGTKTRGVEILEVVCVPGVEMVEKMKKEGGDLLVTNKLLASLDDSCKELRSIRLSILRTKAQHWVKEGDVWEKTA
jgi:hypothetical protein